MDERLLGGRAAVLGDAERCHGARVDEAIASRALDGANDVQGAADVDVVEEIGVGGPEPVYGGQMEHRRHVLDCTVERRRIANVAHDAFDRQAREIVVVSSRFAKCSDLVTVVDECAHDRGADESGRAGDENRFGTTTDFGHGWLSPTRTERLDCQPRAFGRRRSTRMRGSGRI